MPRETKAEREAREAKEAAAALRKQKREQKKLEQQAAQQQELNLTAQEGETVPSVLVIDFSDDVKSILKQLISAMNAQKTANTPVTTAVAQQAEQPVAKKPVEYKQQELPLPQKTEEAVPATVSLTEIREMINHKAGEGKTAAIVALLGKHNAPNASSLLESQYAAFYEGLKNL